MLGEGFLRIRGSAAGIDIPDAARLRQVKAAGQRGIIAVDGDKIRFQRQVLHRNGQYTNRLGEGELPIRIPRTYHGDHGQQTGWEGDGRGQIQSEFAALIAPVGHKTAGLRLRRNAGGVEGKVSEGIAAALLQRRLATQLAVQEIVRVFGIVRLFGKNHGTYRRAFGDYGIDMVPVHPGEDGHLVNFVQYIVRLGGFGVLRLDDIGLDGSEFAGRTRFGGLFLCVLGAGEGLHPHKGDGNQRINHFSVHVCSSSSFNRPRNRHRSHNHR